MHQRPESAGTHFRRLIAQEALTSAVDRRPYRRSSPQSPRTQPTSRARFLGEIGRRSFRTLRPRTSHVPYLLYVSVTGVVVFVFLKAYAY